ncbi:PspC domain-containing protein [Plantactinospora sp. B5E13]|uniref:PspC domain-containing protein n=1 Tax=unclassified Plantactinospora TaxID=2631981 RepID=UPI00325D39D4
MTDDPAARGGPRPEGGPEHPDEPDTTPLTPPATPAPEPDTYPTSGSGAGTRPTSGPGGPVGTGGPAPGPGWPGGPPPGPGQTPPPGAGRTPPGAGFTYRYGLVRPAEGRYLAGVCAAIGRATNSDPILWRVLLAVLGFFGGIGILVYVAAWLIIPSEGDDASPVESMLGRGRSSMSPVTVLVLGILVAVLFGFIVTDPYRAVLLGLAVLIGGALLLNRNSDRGVPGQPAPPGGVGPYPPQPPYAGPGHPPTGPVPPAGPGQPGWVTSPTGAGGWPASAPPAPTWPAAPGPTAPWSAGPIPAPVGSPGPVPGAPVTGQPAPLAGQPPYPPFTPPLRGAALPPTRPVPPSGYRPPFAPHGPYAGSGVGTVPPPARPPKPPKKPRERSALGAATFSLIFVALGLVAILDLTDVVKVGPSAYFAAALVTIALGLLVGTWFGRARWLIALGLVAACALGISTVAESSAGRHHNDSVVWAPDSVSALAPSYQTRLGSSTLDLTRVDFTGQAATVRVAVNLGEVRVILPPTVDVTVRVDVQAGDADVLGRRHSDFGGPTREVVDLGDDGTGGGRLTISLSVDAGYAEVTR